MGKRKTAAKRGRSKPVIDYDPLAWLEEAQPDASVPEQTSNAAPVDSAPEESPAEPPADSAEDSGGYGFFGDEPESPPEAGAENATEEGSAYGFFDAPQAADEAAGDGAAGDGAAADEGYGFFEDAPGGPDESGNAAAAATSGDDEDSAAYGFFDDAPAGSAREPWKDEDAVIHLGSELGIRSVQQAHTLIAEVLSAGFDVRIDAGDLQKIDSAGLQMIYSLHMTLEKTGQSIHWERSSELIDKRAAELGLPTLAGESGGATEDSAGYGFF